ncbi:hypothetical protein Q7P37_007705 [Cladosporium fusiforme]
MTGADWRWQPLSAVATGGACRHRLPPPDGRTDPCCPSAPGPNLKDQHLLSFRAASSSSTTVNSITTNPFTNTQSGSWARSYPTNSRQFRFHQQGGLDK